MKRFILLVLAVSLVLMGCSDNGGNKITGAAVGAPCDCSDPDGLNEKTAGETILNSDGKIVKRHDICMGGILTEYYCEGCEIKTQNFRCESGCTNGACK